MTSHHHIPAPLAVPHLDRSRPTRVTRPGEPPP